MKRETLLKELVRIAKLDEIAENEFTVMDYIKECRSQGIQMSEYAARGRLNRMAKDGKINKRTGTFNGSKTVIYSFPAKSKLKMSNPRLNE
jgi:hypothetical protein